MMRTERRWFIGTMFMLGLMAGNAFAFQDSNEAIESGWKKMAAEDVAGSREDFTEGIELAGTNVNSLTSCQIGLAKSYMVEQKWAEARAAYEKVLEIPGQSENNKGVAFREIAETYLTEKNYAKAHESVDEAMAITPEGFALFVHHLVKARIYQDEEKYKEANEVYEKGIKIEGLTPDNQATALIYMAQNLIRLGDATDGEGMSFYEKAMGCSKTVLETSTSDDNKQTGQWGIALALEKMGKEDEALEAYKKCEDMPGPAYYKDESAKKVDSR